MKHASDFQKKYVIYMDFAMKLIQLHDTDQIIKKLVPLMNKKYKHNNRNILMISIVTHKGSNDGPVQDP